MSALAAGIRTAAIRLVAAPGAVFLAVLTAGLAASSAARHTGLFALAAPNGNRPSVVLACPRTRATNAARASAPASATVPCRKYAAQGTAVSAPAAAQTVEAAVVSPRAEKHAETRAAGGVSASIPLPDFNAPELSRFTSPL